MPTIGMKEEQLLGQNYKSERRERWRVGGRGEREGETDRQRQGGRQGDKERRTDRQTETERQREDNL